MDHSTSSGDEDLVRVGSRSREGNNDGRQNNRHHTHHGYQSYNQSRDYDTRSQSSQKSDPNSETSGRGDPSHYNLSATESVGSHGSGGGDSRGFPLHGHVHFRHAAIGATHLLNGDPAHQFPPSLYQPSADAPKSDTATVCSSSMLEDIEDVGSHYDGESTQSGHPKQHHHNYPPPSILRRSNSQEGNRLVDFADRSQAVFPKQSKSASHVGLSQESSPSNNDEDVSAGNATQQSKGMGPPLSRHWLMQHHGISPFRTGSVKSGGSNAGSDVIVNVGSDCGGSITDVQSILSQEDASLLMPTNSENSSEVQLIASVASAAKSDALDTSTNTNSATAAAAEDEKKPHPLLCDQSSSKTSGRISPGGTIYRGRGVRRYKGRFYALPLKRFHQDGVHLHSDSGSWDDRYGRNPRDDHQYDGDNHNYHGHLSSRYEGDSERGHNRSRSRSRSRSPPAGDRIREPFNRGSIQSRGYETQRNNKDRST